MDANRPTIAAGRLSLRRTGSLSPNVIRGHLMSKEVADGIAIALLQGEYEAGDSVIVDAEDGKLIFTKGRDERV